MNGLFIVPTDLDDLRAKGVAGMLHERSEGGFLSRVVTVHPFAQSDRTVALSDDHLLVEFAPRISGGWRPLRWLRLAAHLSSVVRACAALIRREGLDFVRAQDPYYCGLIGWLAARMTARAFCISLHADYDKRYALDGARGAPVVLGSRALAKRLEKFLLKRADLVMPIRQSLGMKAIAEGVLADRVTVIPHQVDFAEAWGLPSSLPDSMTQLAANRKVFLMTGRISRENYVYDLVEVALRLSERRDFIFVLAGPGPELEAIRAMCAEDAALAAVVAVTGPLDRPAAMAAQRAAYAGLALMGGFSLIEFCAAARPVVAYDVEWHRDLVIDGETGFLVREGDCEGVARAVTALLDDPVLTDRMGAAARARAIPRHSKEAVSEVRRECYRRLVAAGSVIHA